ncbi:hypothetical protein L226DRAFT_493796 [Lentinus tigrinus ALCF2SS1-7]|uniref:WDR59/RTC1-like RING zinc finger domain-containing protein n=1 Tax=Lentinus tigrinus ALCF2SS1-6 TaxID=1328759 RepID=A0A5C2S595_9APHY|nr:hypothetical protein L227DRAFT_550240 [Lentinus tigrinus ALCF2SS1-6]RPD69837.1 hypothetical protein L226DRAFT_493796 [Lentinus tigrinus ALCF2SS1-7]
MLLSGVGPSNRRSSVINNGGFNLTLPEVFSDSREHGYRGPTRHVRLPRATTNGGGSIAKSEDGARCVVAGRESLRILRMSEVTTPGSVTQSDHKSTTGRGGHRIEASRNFWEGSGLKVDSSSTDVVWCHGAFNNKILTGARNGELIMWDLNKNGSSKYERRTRDHARSIHVLQYSPILQSYCMTGSADGDLRIWDIRDLTKSIMRIHHPTAVRAVAFSPVSSQSRHVVAALDNGSIYRWDLNMGQRGQLDRIPVAHSGPILSLDWVQPSTASSTLVPSLRQSASSNWYGSGSGFFDDILPSVPIASTTTVPSPDTDNSGPGWIISGGMDRSVKVWDLTTPATRHTSHRPTYTLHTSFPVRRVLWRPGYECELAIVSNADFGTGMDFGHGGLPAGSSAASGGLGTAMPSPRIPTAHFSDPSGTPQDRAKSVTPNDGSDPVEIWDVRRGYIAKWVVNGSAVEGGVTDIDFADSHALWALHSSGTFSQLDLRQSWRPLDAIPRSAISWNTTGSIAFVADKPKRWEVPYDDIDSESKKDQVPIKALGDPSYRPVTQNVGAFAHDGAAEDLDMITKLARGYIYTDKEKPQICAHNAEVAIDAGAHDAAQTWLILESLLTEVSVPPTPPLSPLPFNNPQLPHSTSAPAAIPTVHSLPHSPVPQSQRSMTVDATILGRQKDHSPGSRSKNSDDRHPRSTSGHRSPHGITPTSSTASSPRKSSTGLPPTVPAAIFARRESGAGLPPPLRPRLPSFRRPSFSTQSLNSAHSESPSDSLRSHLSSLRHVGEGALDDSDSSESGSDDETADDAKHGGDREGEGDGDSHPPSSASSSRGPATPHLYRTTTAHPSPLSRLALSQQGWTEDEKDDDDSPSPASTSAGSSEEEESDDAHARRSGSGLARRPSAVRMKRRSSTRSKTRSRSSTVASLAVAPPPPLRRIVKRDSQSSIRTVTVGEVTPGGTLSRAEGALKRDDTIRDLSGGKAGSVRASSSSLHQRAKSEAPSDFMFDAEKSEGLGMQTPHSAARSQSDRTRVAIREAEDRLRQLAWETMRERFERYSDEGDIIMCAMLALVVPQELKITKSRIDRFIEAYIEILSRLRLHTCAAYIRKFVPVDDIRAKTSMQTTIYTTCGKCRKPLVLPAGPMVRAGKPSGSFGLCTGCRASITKCSICHLPVRSLMFQCPVCLHGGHQDCYSEYYMRRPPDPITPPSIPPSMRHGRTLDTNPPRGRALSRTNSSYTGDGESDDGASAQGDGEGTTGSYNSARGIVVSSSSTVLGRLCAAGCGHHCWIDHDKS